MNEEFKLSNPQVAAKQSIFLFIYLLIFGAAIPLTPNDHLKTIKAFY